MLPARLDRYDPSMLDMLCLAGEVGWARLSTPKLLEARVRHADSALSPRARRCLACPPSQGRQRRAGLTTMRVWCWRGCASRGASFFNDIASRRGVRSEAAPARHGHSRRGRTCRSPTDSPASRLLVATAQGKLFKQDRRATSPDAGPQCAQDDARAARRRGRTSGTDAAETVRHRFSTAADARSRTPRRGAS